MPSDRTIDRSSSAYCDGCGAVAEHVVVARVLALELHAAVRDPHERIEPEQRERELPGELRERVEPLHVRHLVHEHEAAALFGPVVGVVGQQHDGIDDAPRHGNAELVAAEQDERTVDAGACALSAAPATASFRRRRGRRLRASDATIDVPTASRSSTMSAPS